MQTRSTALRYAPHFFPLLRYPLSGFRCFSLLLLFIALCGTRRSLLTTRLYVTRSFVHSLRRLVPYLPLNDHSGERTEKTMIRHGPKKCHLLLLTLLLICNSIITNGEPIDLPSVRLDAVGQLGFAGDYAGISPFKDTRQFESIPDPDVYSIILENNGTFDLLASANGAIFATCTMDAGDQVYIGGQFTMLNNTPISNIARFDTATGVLSPLGQGLDGAVRSLLCDTDAVYVGGDFTAPVGVSNDSLPFYGGHAAIWQPSSNTWLPVPWRGFNGPVYTITRNQAMQTILFGGRFDATGDGQYYNSNTSQPVNLNSPTVRGTLCMARLLQN